MDKVYEELDEVKAENEKLREDCRRKSELSESLKKAHNEQLIKIQDVSSNFEKQSQQLLEKEEQITLLRQMHEDLKCSLHEKESITKSLIAANDKLRADRDGRYKKWEEENRGLLSALDEANEKSIDQEQTINVLKAEIEGLKALLSVSQKKCSEAEKKAKNAKELRERDDMLLKLEEENRKVEDRLKWKMEQFKHLEEAHEKLRDQFKVSKEEWDQEKSALLDEICSLQTSLDSQTRISKDLQHRLQLCNQALAHEETRRKYLEFEVSEFRMRFDSVFAECEDAKSQLECLTAQRDKDIASLRHLLGTKETFYKELEYRAGKLEQENQELIISIKELQEARIQEAGGSSSLLKLRNKLRSLEQMHRNCSENLQAKEVEWSCQLRKIISELDDYKFQLTIKDAELRKLEIEFEGCLSEAVQLKLQNEENIVMLLVLKSVISEAELKLANTEAQVGLHEKEREEKVSLLMQQLDMKNIALAKAQRDVEEEHKREEALLRRVESLELIEYQQHLLQRELERSKEMLEESSRCQTRLKEQALKKESESKEELKRVCDALDMANSELAEERKKVANLLTRIGSLDLIEDQRLLMQKELERYKVMSEEAYKSQLCLQEQALQIEIQSQEKLREVSNALEAAKSDLAEEREKANSLWKRIESLDHIEEQQTLMQKEHERYKEMVEQSSRCQIHLEEQLLQVEMVSQRKLKEACDALENANSELLEKTCEGHEIEFELWIWKSIAERLKFELEENHELRKELEASLLAQAEAGEILKEEKDSRINSLQQLVLSLEQQLKTRELEVVSSAKMETARSFESEKESFLQITREKDKILEDLLKEIEWLEQESFRRELEVAAFTHISAERMHKHEKENLLLLVKEKDQRIDGLMQVLASTEEKFNCSLKSFSSQLVEKQTEIDMIHEAWEKIARAEVLAELEIEERKLMILELEEDIKNIQGRLLLQEKSLSDSKQLAMKIEAELEAKQWEMKHLGSQMEAKLKTSDALIDELKSEKRDLLEDVMKLSMEREHLFGFVRELDDRIGEFSSEDMQIMGTLGKLVQSFDNNVSGLVVKGSEQIFDPTKENMHSLSSPTMKKPDCVIEERSPFRQLN